MTTSPSGRDGPGSSSPWPMTCSSTTSAAAPSPAARSTPRGSWTGGVAQAFRGRVFDFVWIDDFAAARHAALARATGDYVFWLDADHVVDPPQRERLRRLLDGLRPGDEAAYGVRCACDPDSLGG